MSPALDDAAGAMIFCLFEALTDGGGGNGDGRSEEEEEKGGVGWTQEEGNAQENTQGAAQKQAVAGGRFIFFHTTHKQPLVPVDLTRRSGCSKQQHEQELFPVPSLGAGGAGPPAS